MLYIVNYLNSFFILPWDAEEGNLLQTLVINSLFQLPSVLRMPEFHSTVLNFYLYTFRIKLACLRIVYSLTKYLWYAICTVSWSALLFLLNNKFPAYLSFSRKETDFEPDSS